MKQRSVLRLCCMLKAVLLEIKLVDYFLVPPCLTADWLTSGLAEYIIGSRLSLLSSLLFVIDYSNCCEKTLC